MEGLKRPQYLLIVFLLSFVQVIPSAVEAQKFSFVSKPLHRVEQGSAYQYTFLAIDSIGRAIHYTCNKIPSWIHFNKENNTLSGVAKKQGQYPVQIDAATGDTIISQHFMLTVYDKQTVNILPLGNSITNGTSIYNSYRRDLWQLLHQASYDFDLIGSWDQHHMGGPVPAPDFDMDHEGHSGWTIHNVLEPPGWDEQRGNIDRWLQQYRPDIVLVELGTNDVFQCVGVKDAMKDLAVIVSKCRQKNPSVRMLLSQVPPLGDQWAPKKLCGTDTAYAQAVKTFNEAILRFGKEQATLRSPVIIVDQFTGVDPATDMYDDIHPNASGEQKMASRWYEAIRPFLKKLK